MIRKLKKYTEKRYIVHLTLQAMEEDILLQQSYIKILF